MVGRSRVQISSFSFPRCIKCTPRPSHHASFWRLAIWSIWLISLDRVTYSRSSIFEILTLYFLILLSATSSHLTDDIHSTFNTVWNQTKTVPLFLCILIFPLINFKSPTFFTKFNALGKCYIVACYYNPIYNWTNMRWTRIAYLKSSKALQWIERVVVLCVYSMHAHSFNDKSDCIIIRPNNNKYKKMQKWSDEQHKGF